MCVREWLATFLHLAKPAEPNLFPSTARATAGDILSRAREGWGCDREVAAKTSV
jgi:hypothetical protein